MKDNYSFWKDCNRYSLVGVIIFKINIFSNKQTLHMYITIIEKINHQKNKLSFSNFLKKNYFFGNIIV